MKTSTILLGAAVAGIALYFFSKGNKGAGESYLTSPAGYAGNPYNIYTAGYDASTINTAPKTAAVTTTNPNTQTSTQNKAPTIKTSRSGSSVQTKVINDVFGKAVTNLRGAVGVPSGTGEDIATAQNFARGIVGTPNAQGGFTYRL